MPKYVYCCTACKGEFQVNHRLGETVESCQLCDAASTLVRKPSAIFLGKKHSNLGNKTKVGELVRQTIEEASYDLKKEQEALTKREYSDGD